MNSGQTRLLFRLDVSRVAALLRRPTPLSVISIGLPVVFLGGGLWALGTIGGEGQVQLSGGTTYSLLVSGLVAFLSYGLLFSGSDDGFLRRNGADAGALFVERSVRLVLAAVAISAALLVPAAAAGLPLSRSLAAVSATTFASCASACLAFAAAAGTLARGRGRSLGVGIQFDPELARAAPLVYAPLIPFLVGAGFGALVERGGMVGVIAFGAAASALVPSIYLAASRFQRAAPRFQPQVREMGYVPPPEAAESFRVGRGLLGLLPRRVAAVSLRDAGVAARRFAWAQRVAWLVAIVSIVALARWGDSPVTRSWVVLAVGVTLVVQGGAVVGIGRFERAGTRWLDRSVGLRWWERFLGRWSWAFGLSLWLLIPIALSWTWWSGVPGGWWWPVAGAFGATLSTTASLVHSERR